MSVCVCVRVSERRESIAEELGQQLQEHIWKRGRGQTRRGQARGRGGLPPISPPSQLQGREPGQPAVTCPMLMNPYLLAMRLASGKPPAILTAQWLV